VKSFGVDIVVRFLSQHHEFSGGAPVNKCCRAVSELVKD
jgi:hypothetical protein